MWIRRTSRGRRDLPLSFREVDGIWVGWEAAAVAAVVAFVGAVGRSLLLVLGAACDEVWFMLGLLEDGSVGGVWAVACSWPGEAIF